jgi:hypothetical protein
MDESIRERSGDAHGERPRRRRDDADPATTPAVSAGEKAAVLGITDRHLVAAFDRLRSGVVPAATTCTDAEDVASYIVPGAMIVQVWREATAAQLTAAVNFLLKVAEQRR